MTEAEAAAAQHGTSAPAGGVDLRIDVPHPARMYDYFLGGKDNFPADRETGEQVLKLFPSSRIVVRQNRLFMARATRYLAAEAGIRQFLDIGTGIPTSPNLHEVAQQVAPESRVVYTDNDPATLAQPSRLLISIYWLAGPVFGSFPGCTGLTAWSQRAGAVFLPPHRRSFLVPSY
nr:SAM-dependent methyltransferase [Frankia sp. R82]